MINEWMSYFMVHFIMVLGISLLTKSDLVEQFASLEKVREGRRR